MGSEMEKEMNEIIKKNLPQHVGEELKKRLEQADEDAEKVKQYKQTIIARDKEVSDFRDKIREYNAFDERNSGLDKREKDIAERERNTELEKLKYELGAEKEKTKFTQDVAMGLVRNTEYRKNVMINEHGPDGTKDQYGNQNYINKTHTSDESTSKG